MEEWMVGAYPKVFNTRNSWKKIIDMKIYLLYCEPGNNLTRH